MGSVIEKMGRRKGDLLSMNPVGSRYRLEFLVPSRGLFGYRSEFLTDTRGEGIMSSVLDSYAPVKGEIERRKTGSLVAFESGEACTYGLFNAQERGVLFIGPGTQVYAGMVVGICSRNEDMTVNVCKKKQLTNTRAAGVTAFCEKPLFLSELRRVLEEPYGAEPACKPAQPDAAELKGKKLLLVEDNALNRELALEILKEAGFAVDTAEDGEIAVQKMKQAAPGQYDLILMDIQMPKMDGYEATRQIRALPDAAKAGIPIFAMTANAFEEDRQNALKAGMDGHIAKPLDIPHLQQGGDAYGDVRLVLDRQPACDARRHDGQSVGRRARGDFHVVVRSGDGGHLRCG